nr:immunoglobulin light chain junction region [Macaca mulatta]MOW28007.1 immunoglobulin light chain junction region [Macaca mulatta]MOW28120.1 immunoglobulin light chain junction region [Macaca mulatta]MOW28169.1 immunoglobulin light chain junction region [Macaca mulatta]MOW29960.1 immunoglobulin light chain junction region [Macaca mulatta]
DYYCLSYDSSLSAQYIF